MKNIGFSLILLSFVVMATEYHLKSSVGYLVFIATGIYIFLSVFIFMPKQVVTIFTEEGLADTKFKLLLIKFQLGAILFLTFLYFILVILGYGKSDFIWWVLFVLIPAFVFTIIFLKYKKNK